MTELQATLEFQIELTKFYNVDLFQRGYYQLRTSLKSTPRYPARIEVSLPRNSECSLVFPATVINGVAVSKTFQILYRNEDVQLSDVIVFKVHMLVDSHRIEQCIAEAEFVLNVDLWFTDEEFGPKEMGKYLERPENTDKLTCICSRSLKLHMQAKQGLHHHVQLLFDYFHLACVCLSVHGTLLALHQPYITVPNKPPRPGWSKTGDHASLESILFNGKVPSTTQSKGFNQSVRLKCASSTYKNLITVLLSAYESLQLSYQHISSKLPPYQRVEIETNDCAERLNLLMEVVTSFNSEEDFLEMVRSDIAQLCAENVILWTQYLEMVTQSDKVHYLLAREHHLSRVKRFAEGFFTLEQHKSEMLACYDPSTHGHVEIANLVRSSQYFGLVPPLAIEVSELDGDSVTNAVIFEDVYTETMVAKEFKSEEIRETRAMSDSVVKTRGSDSSSDTSQSPRSKRQRQRKLIRSMKPENFRRPSSFAETPHRGSVAMDEGGGQASLIGFRKLNPDTNRPTQEIGTLSPGTTSAKSRLTDFSMEPATSFSRSTLSSSRSTVSSSGSLPDLQRAGSMRRSASPFANRKSTERTAVGGVNAEVRRVSSLDITSNSIRNSDFPLRKQNTSESSAPKEDTMVMTSSQSAPKPVNSSDEPDELEGKPIGGSIDSIRSIVSGEDSKPHPSPAAEETTKPEVSVTSPDEKPSSEHVADATDEQKLPVSSEASSSSTEQDALHVEAGYISSDPVSDATDSGAAAAAVDDAKPAETDDVAKDVAASTAAAVDYKALAEDLTNALGDAETQQKAVTSPSEDNKTTPVSLNEEETRVEENQPSNEINSEIAVKESSESDVNNKVQKDVELVEGSDVTNVSKEDAKVTDDNGARTLDLETESSKEATVDDVKVVENGGVVNDKYLSGKCTLLELLSEGYDPPEKEEEEETPPVKQSSSPSMQMTYRLGKKRDLQQGMTSSASTPELSQGQREKMQPLVPLVCDNTINFITAKETLRKQLKYNGHLYSDFPNQASTCPYYWPYEVPYKSDHQLEKHLRSKKGVHLIVCVHGLDGNSADLRLIRTYIETALPGGRVDFLMSERNQPDTFADFETMTDRLVQEILYHIELYGLNPERVSFVGHSLGTLIIRSALAKVELAPLLPKLYTFLSLSGPHLGTLYNNSGLVNMGMWFMQKWKKSGSLLQLSMKDNSDPRQTFLYQLSLKPGMEFFRNILLVGSTQDRYVPFHSSRIEICKAAIRDTSGIGGVYVEMVNNILQPIVFRSDVNLVRYDVFHALNNTANNLIGRAAHIAVLDSELFIEKFITVSALKYFK